MKKVFTTAVLAAALMSSAATAADINNYDRSSASARPANYNWQGLYLGGNIGYQWGTVTNNPTHPSGFAGGVGLGYNWQYGQFVYGVETDVQLSGADDSIPPTKFVSPWYMVSPLSQPCDCQMSKISRVMYSDVKRLMIRPAHKLMPKPFN